MGVRLLGAHLVTGHGDSARDDQRKIVCATLQVGLDGFGGRGTDVVTHAHRRRVESSCTDRVKYVSGSAAARREDLFLLAHRDLCLDRAHDHGRIRIVDDASFPIGLLDQGGSFESAFALGLAIVLVNRGPVALLLDACLEFT